MGDEEELPSCDDFYSAFLNCLFLQELKEAKAKEFMILRQGRMAVKKYALKFNQLLYYAPKLVSSTRA